MLSSRLTACLFALTVCAVLFGARSTPAVDRTVVGSVQLDYHLVPTAPGANPNAGSDPANPSAMSVFNGITTEAALKLSADVSGNVAAAIKVCFGCHGFEADMAYVDFRVADELNFRLGRFSPSFGSYNLRHDPANHKLSDKPLPYDMGRMLRKSEWNLGVLPSPFPDNGLEIDGTHWLGETTQFDYAIYAVQGFRNTSMHSTDIDFTESHFPYYYFVEDNPVPTAGARLAVTHKLGDAADVTFGASGMYGPYDPFDRLAYAIVGADLGVRVQRTNVRIEYLVRRTDMDTSDPSQFKYAMAPFDSSFFLKHGAYAEVEQPITAAVDVVVRADGLFRIGNVLATSLLSSKTWVTRETVGLAWAIRRNFRVKSSVELWQFRDADLNGQTGALGIHLAGVASF
jgi:hypothetical protein